MLQVMAYVFTVGVQVFLMAFILRKVSEAAYGVFLLAMGAEYAFVLIAQTVGKGATIEIARAIERGSSESINRIISSACAALTTVSIIGATSLWALSGHLPEWMNVGSELSQSMTHMLRLGALTVVVTLSLTPFVGLSMAHQKYGVVVMGRIAGRIARAATIICLLELFPNWLEGLMVGVVVDNVVSHGLPCVVGVYVYRDLRVTVGRIRWKVIVGLLGFAALLAGSVVCNVGAMEALKWLLGRVSMEYVTHFAVTLYVTTVAMALVSNVTTTIVPVASKYHAAGNNRLLGELFILSSRYALGLSLIPVCVLLPSSAYLFALWLKPSLASLAPYAIAVGWSFVVVSPGSGAMQILTGMSDAKTPLWAYVAKGAMILITGAVGIMFLNWGVGGAVVSICCGHFASVSVLVWAIRKKVVFSMRQFLWSGYLQPLIAGVAAFSIGSAITHYMTPSAWGSLVCVWVVSGISLCLSGLVISSPRERRMLKGVILRIASFRTRVK